MLQEFLEINTWKFLLIMTRVGTVTFLAPGLAASYVPTPFRIGFTLAVSFILLPVVSDQLPDLPQSAMMLFLIVAGEVVIGAFLASIGVVIMSALQAAGTFISLFSSMANALIQDAVSNQQSSVVSGFLSMSGLVLVFVSDLHHMYLRAVADSFTLFRAGEPIMFGDMSNIIARHVSDAFELGLKLSAPLLLSALVYYLALGVLGRLMPTLQVFFFGLPVQITVQIWVLMICFSGMMLVFLGAFTDAYVPFLAQ